MRIVNGVKCFTKADATKITPAMANALLEKSVCIKPVKKVDVAKMVKDLNDGNFEWNGASIVLNSKGELVDGQHRCHACVISGKPFSAVIVSGIDFQGQLTVDTGRPRNIVQYLGSLGHKNPALLSNSAKLLYAFSNADATSDGKLPTDTSSITANDILVTIEQNPCLVNSVAAVVAKRDEMMFMYSTALLSTLDYITRCIEKREDVADNFLYVSGGDITNSKDHPAYILRSKMIYDLSRKGVRPDKIIEGNLLIKAYNMHKQNLRCRSIKLEEGETPSIWLYSSQEDSE